MNRKHLRVMGLAIAVLFLMSGLAIADQARQATISNLGGEVLVRQGQGHWQSAQMGMVLNVGDELKTANGAFAEITLDQGQVGTVKVDQGSLFKIDSMDSNPATGDKNTLLDLAIGKVLVHAGKLQGDSKFEVRTPTSTTGVRGTVFEVSVE